MPYPLPLTRTEAYLAYKAGVIQQSDLKPSLAVPRNGIDAWLAYWTGLAADYPKREDGTPHILQEEEAYIAYLSGVINEYPEKCLRRVGAYLRYLISARWGRPDHPLNREELYLSLIKTQVVPSGDPSSDIVIDGTTKAPFVDVKMYGDTFQQTYTGKNLFDVDTETNYFIDSNGNLIAGQTWSLSEYIKVSPNTTYVWHGEQTGTLGGQVIWAGYDSSQAFISGQYAQTNNTTSTSFTTGNTTEYIRVGYRNDRLGSMQLELGSTASSYEPFVGGQPSPSPDYPQTIQTVTGEQTVTVVGKNLLKLNDGATTLGGVHITTTNGTVNLNGTATSGAQGYYVTIGITASEPMVFSTNKSGATSGLDIKLQYKRNGTIYYPSVGSSFSLQAGDIIQQMYLMITNGSALDCSFSPMLEKGSTETSFAPYSKQTYTINLGSIELCKIVGFGSSIYRDTIYKNLTDSKWYLKKELGKYVFNGSEAWSQSGRTTTDMYVGALGIVSLGITAGESRNKSLANRAIITSASVAGTFSIFNTSSGVSQYMCYAVSSSYASSLTQFKGKLATDNLIVYAPLAVPTDTEITDTTLIAQLEALLNGGAEDGTTYIKVDAADPNLPGLLYVEAPKYE